MNLVPIQPVGTKVRMKKSSSHYYQCLESISNKPTSGVIWKHDPADRSSLLSGLVHINDYVYRVRWENGYQDIYRTSDLDFITDSMTNKQAASIFLRKG